MIMKCVSICIKNNNLTLFNILLYFKFNIKLMPVIQWDHLQDPLDVDKKKAKKVNEKITYNNRYS